MCPRAACRPTLRLQTSRGERLVVGLTGYPNVGKSSTINALFGSKKTAVAPTPGKTKHFQVGGPAGWHAGVPGLRCAGSCRLWACAVAGAAPPAALRRPAHRAWCLCVARPGPCILY